MNKGVSIPAKVSEKVLTIGLPYIDFKGGISMVINTYSKYFQVFNFLSTYKRSNYKLVTAFYFPVFIIKFCKYLLINKQIEIVHIHGAAGGSLFRKSFVFIIAKYLFGKKVIYHSHGSELVMFYEKSNWVVKKYTDWFFGGVDVIICLSQKWESFFRKNFNVKRIVILENIIEKNDCPAKQPVAKESKIVFLFLGSVGYRKGVFDLLDVINENKEYFTGKILLRIAGRGEIKRLENFLDTNKLHEIVQFVGWITGEEKKKLLSESDIYILPSYNEGLPISILEAMSFRLPIVSTTVGGIPEIVKNGENGFLITPGDKQEMFERIKWFIENKNDIDKFGEHSFETVKPYYADVVIPRLQDVYISLLKKYSEVSTVIKNELQLTEISRKK
jgi:glycosyltransferase involved in cell wall biosynthesis